MNDKQTKPSSPIPEKSIRDGMPPAAIPTTSHISPGFGMSSFFGASFVSCASKCSDHWPRRIRGRTFSSEVQTARPQVCLCKSCLCLQQVQFVQGRAWPRYRSLRGSVRRSSSSRQRWCYRSDNHGRTRSHRYTEARSRRSDGFSGRHAGSSEGGRTRPRKQHI